MVDRAQMPRILIAGLLVAVAAACSAPASGTSGPGVTAGPGAGTARPQGSVGTAQPGGSAVAVGTGKAACDLLTDAEIADITGYSVESKEAGRSDAGYLNNCTWLFVGNAWVIVLGIQEAGGASAYDRSFEYESGTLVDGLGDRAFVGEVSDSLFALRGDTLINLQLVAVGEPDGVEQRLVERVLANLGR